MNFKQRKKEEEKMIFRDLLGLISCDVNWKSGDRKSDKLLNSCSKRIIKRFEFLLSDYKKELGEKLSTWRGGYIKSDLGEDMFNELVSLLQKDKEISK